MCTCSDIVNSPGEQGVQENSTLHIQRSCGDRHKEGIGLYVLVCWLQYWKSLTGVGWEERVVIAREDIELDLFMQMQGRERPWES